MMIVLTKTLHSHWWCIRHLCLNMVSFLSSLMLAKPLSRCCWWCWGWWWCLPPASSSWSPPSWQRPRRGGRGGEGVSFVTQLTFPPSLLGPFTQFGQSPGCLCCCTSTSEVQSTASEAVEGVLPSPNPSRKGSVIAFWSFHCVFVHHSMYQFF